jgi:Icc-related predicted phosphoesterase
MKLIWCSDIHLDHVAFPDELGLYLAPMGDALVITGDISSGLMLRNNLLSLVNSFGKPIYFVLGNHDIWGGSFAEAAADVQDAESIDSKLCWLRRKVVTLAPGVALTGDDGWYDAAYGNAEESQIVMRDWLVISDLSSEWDKGEWSFGDRGHFIYVLRKFALQAALRAEESLREAANDHSRVIFATHIPPFKELAERPRDRDNFDWLPWYASKAMGDALLKVAAEFPQVQFEVLCGHTHARGKFAPADNLKARSSKAIYGHPDYEEIIQL